MIRRAFTGELNTGTFHRLNLFVGGLKTSLTVDNYIPFDVQLDRPAFVTGKTWVDLLVKAFAKVYQRYDKLSRKGDITIQTQ